MLTTLVHIVLIWIHTKNHIFIMFLRIIIYFSTFIYHVFITYRILLFWK